MDRSNRFFVPHGVRKTALSVCCALLCLARVFLGSAARADLTIVTPSPSILQPHQFSAQGLLGIEQTARDAAWVSGSINYIELQGAQLWGVGEQASVLSIQAQLLPETAVTPSASIGIRDLFDTTHHFGDFGYGGRSLYAVAGESAPGASASAYPLRNLSYTLGVGTAVTNGLFASASSDIAENLQDTIEFDGKTINYRLSLTPGNGNISLEYDRIDGTDFVGLHLQTPGSAVFDPFE